MPRDNDKNNDSRVAGVTGPAAARDAPASRGGRRRSSPSAASRAKKFDGDRGGDKPRFSRDDRPRGDRPFRDRPARDGDGEKRPFKPRER